MSYLQMKQYLKDISHTKQHTQCSLQISTMYWIVIGHEQKWYQVSGADAGFRVIGGGGGGGRQWRIQDFSEGGA